MPLSFTKNILTCYASWLRWLLFGMVVLGIISPLTASESDSAQVLIGERLFLETRFAQAFYANPDQADTALAYTLTTRDPLRGPFAGKTMNCRACHMVDEHGKAEHAGNRSYADFTHVSPIPARNDKLHFTARNSMQMVNINHAGKHGVLLHFDGEFGSMEDLVRATFSGRNFGWLAQEKSIAIKHLARVIREDDGQGPLAREFGGSYKMIFTGTAKEIDEKFRLPAAFRVDVNKASDIEIFDAVAKLVAAYVDDLNFSKDAQGQYNGSPYDQFLKLNKLPRAPNKGESLPAYTQRLLEAVAALKKVKFVSAEQGKFATHRQVYAFGKQELAGMKFFFRRGSATRRGGNCVSCHHAPHFSDFSFHNTGLTQVNYDEAHGQGSFAKLDIPALKQRNADYDAYLPATDKHPRARERFRRPITAEKTDYVDLGMWNIFANPDMPAPQTVLRSVSCKLAKRTGQQDCSDQNLLPLTIATFKTPVLRDLGHSDPYMHTGQFTNLKETVAFYITASALAKAGVLRNGDPELAQINMSQADVAPLVVFINSLNEDYD